MVFNRLSVSKAGHKFTSLEYILKVLSVYLIPACMVLATFWAITMLDPARPKVTGTPIKISVLPTSEQTKLDPTTAYETINQQPDATNISGGLHNWILLNIPAQQSLSDYLIEMPSRHLRSVTCWNADSMQVIGKSNELSAKEYYYSSNLGFNLLVGQIPVNHHVLCHASFSQATPINAYLWTIPDFHNAKSAYEYGIGMLEGGLLAPALLALLMGLITREATYALLAAWLVTNLRLGAYAIGWDSQWIGHQLPADLMPLLRTLNAALYYLFTVSLLSHLLKINKVTGKPAILSVAQASALVMPILAIILPSEFFWPTIGITALFALIAAIISITKAAESMHLGIWFWQVLALAIAFSLLIGLSLLLVFGNINTADSSLTTFLLLLSSAAIGLAFIERIRNTRTAQLRLQTELVTNYAISPIGRFTLDAHGKFIRMNPVLENMLGFTLLDRPEAVWSDYFDDLNWGELDAKAQANKDTEITSRIKGTSGKPRHFAIRAIAIEKTIEGSLQDISAQTALINQLRVMSGKDPVTDALNQKGFELAVNKALKHLSSENPASLAYLNLSHFKNINSFFGYATGDALLTQTRQLITSSLSQLHELGRLGSDEFAILFPNKSATEVEPTVQYLAHTINSHVFEVGANAMTVKASIGLIDLGIDTKTAKEALFAAGRASRDAAKSPNKIATYTSNSAALREHKEFLHLFDQMESGITPDGFGIELQPMLSMSNYANEWCFEALLRVHNSNGQPISAGRFVAAAEDIGAITTIDKWVLEYVLSWLEEHHKKLNKLSLVSINVSGFSLSSEPFTQHLFRLLDRYKHLANKLIIEMTESAALENLERAQLVMHQLKALGIRVGLDDFGSGYTSFSYLRNLKADVIKIDGSLIQNMLKSESNIAIVRTIIQLASHLNMKCIAEWVEDIPTLQLLQDMGIHYAQGFVLSSSLPLHKVLQAKNINELLQTDEARAFVNQLKK